MSSAASVLPCHRMVASSFGLHGRRGVHVLASLFRRNCPFAILAAGIIAVGLALRLSMAWQDLEAHRMPEGERRQLRLQSALLCS